MKIPHLHAEEIRAHVLRGESTLDELTRVVDIPEVNELMMVGCIALVVGNAGYQAGALTTPANDAGLIAQTLQAAGFDVVGARDLDQDGLRRAFRDFLEKATNAGPDPFVTGTDIWLGPAAGN